MQNIRTQMILGENSLEKLRNSHVLIVGVGGVGGYSVEALVRSGVGSITICDHDTVSLSNINRQLCALHSTIGEYKVDVLYKRSLDINPNIKIRALKEYYTKDNRDEILDLEYDYIIDAIDSVTSKIDLIKSATSKNIPIISAMGTGNKLDPSKFQICDISKTSVCPLARVMRKELKNRGIYKHKVLFSTEIPRKPEQLDEIPDGKGNVPGSISFVPSVAGLMIAGYVINEIVGEK
ncbi:MAG: tRNA threonylcarbamoyladenosine dehydratase [Clostridia bacterium]